MLDVPVVAIHVMVSLAKLLRPGGIRAVAGSRWRRNRKKASKCASSYRMYNVHRGAQIVILLCGALVKRAPRI